MAFLRTTTGEQRMNGKIIGIVVGLALLGAIVFNLRSGGGADMAIAPIELEISDMQQLAEMAPGVRRGNEAAPITILEFADFQCPGCGAFASTVKPQVDIGFIDTGAANFVFYDFPLTSIHPHAFLAARAARCADAQDLFWAYHDELFRNQSAWSFAAAPPVGAFEDYAAQVGLDQGEFRSCLRSDAYADVVTANMQLGQGLGVPSTPTVLVTRGNGEVHQVEAATIGEMYPEIQALVERLQAEIAAEAGGRP
jgi:protein-disulfide isomerase